MPAQTHETFNPPPNADDAWLWRYMDFGKFANMLLTGSLFLTKLNCLSDPFEGSLPSAIRNHRRDLDALIAKLQSGPVDGQPVDALAGLERERTDLDLIRNFYKESRNEIFVNCWHLAEHESAGMWRLYSTSQESISIKVRYSDLAGVVPSWCYLGMVRYIDYDVDSFSLGQLLNVCMHKRRSFEHEKEARVVGWLPEMTNANNAHLGLGARVGEARIPVEIDLRKLINAVYISPECAGWFRDTVEGVIRATGYDFPVHQSALASPALF